MVYDHHYNEKKYNLTNIKKAKLIIIIVLILFIFSCSNVSSRFKVTNLSTDFIPISLYYQFPSHSLKIKLYFDYLSNYIIADVEINNCDGTNFTLRETNNYYSKSMYTVPPELYMQIIKLLNNLDLFNFIDRESHLIHQMPKIKSSLTIGVHPKSITINVDNPNLYNSHYQIQLFNQICNSIFKAGKYNN